LITKGDNAALTPKLGDGSHCRQRGGLSKESFTQLVIIYGRGAPAIFEHK
jgi:hypothetical protein